MQINLGVTGKVKDLERSLVKLVTANLGATIILKTRRELDKGEFIQN